MSSINIGIIGLGVIGASLGMALRHSITPLQVMGTDTSIDTITTALEIGAIDSTLYEDSIDKCDVIFIASPLRTIPEVINEIRDKLKPGVIVSDVGSVKSWVMQVCTELLPPDVAFIGGHPMAGSEKSGINGADKFLLQNAAYILTPQISTPADKLDHLSQLLELAGARVIIMDAHEHDEMVAKISHLPHLMSASLINNLENRPSSLSMAGGGLRDSTRTAASNPILWEEILMLNSRSLVKELRSIVNQLDSCCTALVNKDSVQLQAFLESARRIKNAMPNKRPFLNDSCDIVAIIPDQPKVIGRLGMLLGDNDINIHDIQLLGVRDEDEGTIRLNIDRENAEKACQLLKASGMPAWIRDNS